MLKVIVNNLKKILTKEQQSILSASAAMMFLMLITKVIGLLTKTVTVSRLGTEKYGIFVAANTLPETLSMLLIFGSITSIIIPILVEALSDKKENSFSRLFSSIINVSLLAFVIISVIIMVFSDMITPVIIREIARPVEPFTDEQIAQIASMMRILLIPQVILGISSFLSSALNAFKRFIIPQIAPLFYNLGILFGVVFLIPLFDFSVWGIVWGVIIGSLLHLAIQIPLSSHLKIKYEFVIDVTNKKLREILSMGLPRMITLAADQIALAVDRVIAIGLGAAPLGAYHLAISLVSIPFSLFSYTFSAASLPHLSSMYVKNNLVSFKNTFSKVFNQILFLTIPVTMILLVLRVPIVRLLYGIIGGEFSWESTLMVSWIVFFFTLGLIAEVLLVFLNRVFFAAHDTVRPLIVGVFTVAGGIVTGILFTNYFSHFDTFSINDLTWNFDYFFSKEGGVAAIGGLALSSSIIYTASFLLLMLFLVSKIGKLNLRKFWVPVFRKLLFGIIMALLMYGLYKVWDEVLDTARTLNVLILTSSTIISGVCLYLWLNYISKDPEIEIVSKVGGTITKIFKNNKKSA